MRPASDPVHTSGQGGMRRWAKMPSISATATGTAGRRAVQSEPALIRPPTADMAGEPYRAWRNIHNSALHYRPRRIDEGQDDKSPRPCRGASTHLSLLNLAARLGVRSLSGARMPPPPIGNNPPKFA